jgi:hypothetical protein
VQQNIHMAARYERKFVQLDGIETVKEIVGNGDKANYNEEIGSLRTEPVNQLC